MQGTVNIRFTGRGLMAVIGGLGRCREAQDEAARAMMWRIRNLINTGARSGRMYGNHQASAPGEPPARHTGRLSDSVKIQRVNQYATSVRVTEEYAVYLEYGTQKIEPRPFISVAAREAQTAMSRRVKKILQTSNVPFTVKNSLDADIESMEG